jgi:hypothetical protein
MGLLLPTALHHGHHPAGVDHRNLGYVAQVTDRHEETGQNRSGRRVQSRLRTRRYHAHTIQAYEKEHSDDIPAVTESRLRCRVSKDLRGGSMSCTTLLLPNGKDGQGDAGWSFRAWMKRKTMSIFALAVCFLLAFFGYITALAAPLPLECGICLYIGTTRRSCLILSFWLYVVISVVPQVALFAALYRFPF